MNTYRLVNRPKEKSTWQRIAERVRATSIGGLHSLIITLAILSMLTIWVLSGKVAASSPLILITVLLTVPCAFICSIYRAGQESKKEVEQPEPVLTNEQFEQLVRETIARANQDNTDPMPVLSNGRKP